MFRKSHDSASSKPLTRRHPAPPISSIFNSASTSSSFAKDSIMSTPSSRGGNNTKNVSNGSAKRLSPWSNARARNRPNMMITSFFKKTDSPFVNARLDGLGDDLFCKNLTGEDINGHMRWSSPESLFGETGKDERFNETGTSNKKRRISSSQADAGELPLDDSMDDLFEDDASDADFNTSQAEDKTTASPTILKENHNVHKKNGQKKAGPFFYDSDSDDENVGFSLGNASTHNQPSAAVEQLPKQDSSALDRPAAVENEIGEHAGHIDTTTLLNKLKEEQNINGVAAVHSTPALLTEATSFAGDEVEDTDSIRKDFEDVDLEELAADSELDDENHINSDNDLYDEEIDTWESISTPKDDVSSDSPSCPICCISLEGISTSDASIHVNNCLDGKPTPLPSKTSSTLSKENVNIKSDAKPSISKPVTSSNSAFSKLMSANAEGAAWSQAAAAAEASRGKPAYTRTCPFYKIMPGFSICVDAFRYGSVKACNAYFLSHFHSDHYMGLNSSWCHGPIYCSRATANLVKQQLRVDAKWVVELEFDKTTEVPDTQGVRVTMIPANHCPGSSLFLFEKQMSSSLKRILHCGDFRACPEHVAHPLLKPDIVDPTTHEITARQIIDVCYLDTTYLNPKYVFPPQEAVVSACVDLCVRLSSGSEPFQAKGPFQAMSSSKRSDAGSGRLLVLIGTYSIGKERLAHAIACALHTKIYTPPRKARLLSALEDAALASILTTNPAEAQVHLVPLGEVNPQTLREYADTSNQQQKQQNKFTRAIAFRPTGWTFKPARTTSVGTIPARPRFSAKDLRAARGSNAQYQVFPVPYSEHSSFRELALFVAGLRITKVIPTVNVGSAKSRDAMRAWIEKWESRRRRHGCVGIDEW